MTQHGLLKLVEEIETLEKRVRKAHPKQKGRVLIANAKSLLDATVGRSDEFRWAVEYRSALEDMVK